MTQETGVCFETCGAIGIATLDKAETKNALTPAMADALSSYFIGLKERPEVRVVILRSNGPVFCAGADLGSDAFSAPGAGRPQRQMAMQQRFSLIPMAMRACPQPIIALIQGAACGAGFSLALAADVRFAEPATRMNAAYLRVGLGGCDMGSGYFLPRLVGLSVASELLLTGNFIHAERARAVGLVSDIVSADSLLDKGLALAADMLRASPMGLRMTKETLGLAVDAPSLAAVMHLEDRQQVILLEMEDHREAVSAFLARRAPVYRDC